MLGPAKLAQLSIRMRYQTLRERAHSNYQTKLKKLDEQLKIEQIKCPHKNVDFNGDPSGNNDSYYECRDCGLAKMRW